MCCTTDKEIIAEVQADLDNSGLFDSFIRLTLEDYMCLCVTDEQTQYLRKDLKEDGFIIGYKVVLLYDMQHLLSKFYRHHRWIRGWNVSDRKAKRLTKHERMTKVVYEGIHVYLNPSDAESSKPIDGIVVKVKCYRQDFIAGGLNNDTAPSAVFTKVYLPRSEHAKARRETQNQV